MRKLNSFIAEDLQLTLEYHDELNPLIWDEDDKMKPKVRQRLLDIGKMWAEFSRIPSSAVRDVILTGGNANYNYTPYSDLDIHLLVNLDSIPVDKDFLEDYLYDKKMLWTIKHPGLTVMGYPVELYAENYRRKVVSEQGSYSLNNDKWLTRPNIMKHPNFDQDIALKKKIEHYIAMIEKVLSEPGDHTVEIKKLKEKIHAMRSAGIQRSGEFSHENLIYKDLRNRGLIDLLGNYLQKAEIAKLSLA